MFGLNPLLDAPQIENSLFPVGYHKSATVMSQSEMNAGGTYDGSICRHGKCNPCRANKLYVPWSWKLVGSLQIFQYSPKA